ncbi:four helix bundle protein [Aquimarina sp. RZ0]|uniref:four helix bundle protein n=1 Tax=Aquimarina sp. RZ0 TaxID=2607730 RepID=UPI0011F22EF9|nr:four helix bundle protein [Aquimarina sp. RZ0]KAA1244823.1 four helix bundle protein [Aquimarina sp. RZ0]
MEYVALEVWKESGILVNNFYEIAKEFHKDKLHGLISQIRRSAVSIPLDIVERCGRRTSEDMIMFLPVSQDSFYKLKIQLYLVLDQDYFNLKVRQNLLDQILKCKKRLNGSVNDYKNL